jgi:SlyX protein
LIATMKDRLSEVEIKLGFAEDLLDELNRTVFRQQQQIEQLLREVRALRRQLEASIPAERATPADEVPPHY